MAVPESETVNDGFEASLVTVKVPVGEPAEVGANKTLNDLLAPAARVNGVVTPLTLYPVPVADTCETVTVVPPLLVMVSDRVLLWFTVTLPKLNGEVVAASAPTLAAVPESDMVSEGFEASLVTVKVPVGVPAVVGASTTLNDLLAPAARVKGVVTPLTPYPVPVAATCETVTVIPPLLVTVSDKVLLCPTVTVPKLNGEVPAESDPAVAPVPVSGIAREGFDASLVTVKDEFAAPLVVGANRTLNDVLAPAPNVIGRVAPVTL